MGRSIATILLEFAAICVEFGKRRRRIPDPLQLDPRTSVVTGTEATMPKYGITAGAALALLLLAGCGGNSPDFAFSQQRAISADMDASFSHGASVADHDT